MNVNHYVGKSYFVIRLTSRATALQCIFLIDNKTSFSSVSQYVIVGLLIESALQCILRDIAVHTSLGKYIRFLQNGRKDYFKARGCKNATEES